MRLENGRYYLTRSNEVIGPVTFSHTVYDMIFYADVDGFLYTDDGGSISNGRNHPKFDLVAESPPLPNEGLKRVPFSELQEGRRYYMRKFKEGDESGITGPLHIKKIGDSPYIFNDGFNFWNARGEFNEDGPRHCLDLVDECVIPTFTPSTGTWLESKLGNCDVFQPVDDGISLNCEHHPEFEINPDALEEIEIELPEQTYCKDAGKADFATVLAEFPLALNGVSELIVRGREKYPERSWNRIPDGIFRRTKCGMRHTQKRLSGQDRDVESGLMHAVHEAWNALCVLELILNEGRE